MSAMSFYVIAFTISVLDQISKFYVDRKSVV